MPSCKASLVHFLCESGLIVIGPVGNRILMDLFDTDSSGVGSLVDVDVFVSALVGHVGVRRACTVEFCRLLPTRCRASVTTTLFDWKKFDCTYAQINNLINRVYQNMITSLLKIGCYVTPYTIPVIETFL